MDLESLKEYSYELDGFDIRYCKKEIAEKGIENFLSQQLIYLDCSRIINGCRTIQTIDHTYRVELNRYLYVVNEFIDTDKQYWIDKLITLHEANLEYEVDNPPIWYGGKKSASDDKKDKNKLPRRRKTSTPMFPEMKEELNNQQRLKRLSAQFGKITFKLNTNG